MLGFLRSPPRRTDGIQVGDGDAAGLEGAHARAQRKAKERENKLFAGRVGRWRYVPAGKDERGREVRFCWSSHRNEFGFFLGWREVFKTYDQMEYRKIRDTINQEHDVVTNHHKRLRGHPGDTIVVFHVYRRYDFIARRCRKRCKEIAEARRDAWKDKHEPAEA